MRAVLPAQDGAASSTNGGPFGDGVGENEGVGAAGLGDGDGDVTGGLGDGLSDAFSEADARGCVAVRADAVWRSPLPP